MSDLSRTPRRYAAMTDAIIAVNVVVFALELLGNDAFFERWALIPNDVVLGRHLETVVTAMFMHAGLMHIGGNMVFFRAFGPCIEDAMGRLRFLLFYLLGGFAAAAAQVAVDPHSTVPNVGASGAIAAVMGAFLVSFPADRIRTVVILGLFVNVAPIRAAILIGLWFVTQLVSEIGLLGSDGSGVAYMAHIGGFAFGALAGRAFERDRGEWRGVEAPPR